MNNLKMTQARVVRPLVLAGALALMSGCAVTKAPNNFFEVTVSPGTSTFCGSDPCTVYFYSPAGSGTHNVVQNGSIPAGVASGGERTLLGLYSNASVVFHVEGTDLPPARLLVIGGP